MDVRAKRNNNPGNIEKGANWQGLMPPEKMNAEQREEKRFCVFVAPQWGIRAIARLLITYQDKRFALDGSKIDTVQEIIERWAPPSENNTKAYVRHVRQKLGIHGNVIKDRVDVHRYEHMYGLVEAILTHEIGYNPYSKEVIDRGLVLAGIESPVKPLASSKTLTAVAATGGGLALSAGQVIETIGGVNATLSIVSGLSPIVQTILTAGVLLSVVGLAVITRERWLKWIRGIA